MKGFLKTTGWMFKLQPKTTSVGRHRDCDLCLQNGGVEEHHALIEWSESERCFVLSDLNSGHGTYVNDCRIHNAAVRLTPGDELHFGYGGSTYRFAVDGPPLLPCPPMSERPACQSALQLIEEPPCLPSPSSPSSQLPHLASQSSAPLAWVWGGSSVTPRPPSRARPASAGAKRMGQQSTAPEKGAASRRPGSWTGSTGNGLPPNNGVVSQNSQTIHHLLQEKEERLLRLGDEVQRLAVFEGESQRKDGVIAGLRDEVAALRRQLTKGPAQPEIRRRLRRLETDISEKKEQIQQLKEQMVDVQRSSVEKHSLTERDLKIASLRGQMERMKRDSSTASGLVASLQRDLSSREKHSLKLTSEVDKLRQDITHKDVQLGSNATKLTKMIKTHQEELFNRENEVLTLKKSVETLEFSLREKQRCLEQHVREKDSLRIRLQKEAEEKASLLAQTETDRRTEEQRSQAELELMEGRVELFRSELLKALRVHPGDSTTQDASSSDRQVLERVSVLLEERESLGSKMDELEVRVKENAAEKYRTAEDAERLKSRLEACQTHVQEACSADALEGAMSALQEECVCPALAWVQASVLSLLGVHLSLLQSTSQALLEASTDGSGSDDTDGGKGVLSGIQRLRRERQTYKAELQHVKAELEAVRGGEALVRQLQDQLASTTEELEQQKQQMSTAQLEEQARGEELEQLRGEVDALKRAQSALQEEARIEEDERRDRFQEEADRREEERRAMVKEAEERGAEGERERYRLGEEEYREQVRQHAHTIVALEQRWAQSRNTAQSLEGERDALRGQIWELEGKLESCQSVRSTSPPQATKPTALEDTITSLRAELTQSQLEARSQGDIIVALSRDLAAANARITDMTGELSEQQKLELEQHKALVVDQRVQLSTLTQKLTLMSQLVEQKGEELKRARQCQADLEKTLSAEREKQGQQQPPEQSQADQCSALACLPQHSQDLATVTTTGELAKQGSKCRGHRHDEVIQNQREALDEMRSKIRALEQALPLRRSVQQVGPKRPVRGETAKFTQRSAAAKGSTTSTSTTSTNGWPQAPGQLGEETLERTARLDLSDALDLSERTYLDLARALCEALELSEAQLEGCASLQHLPQEERTRLGSLRRQDLELLRSRLALQHGHAQRMDTLLREQSREISSLRESREEGRRLQAGMEALRVELEAETQEGSLLREALRRTQGLLDRETSLNRAGRSPKEVSQERPQKKSTRVASHSCVRKEASDKAAAVKTSSLQERLKKREYEVETLKRQLGEKGRELNNMAAQLISAQQQQTQQQEPCQQASPIPEPCC